MVGAADIARFKWISSRILAERHAARQYGFRRRLQIVQCLGQNPPDTFHSEAANDSTAVARASSGNDDKLRYGPDSALADSSIR